MTRSEILDAAKEATTKDRKADSAATKAYKVRACLERGLTKPQIAVELGMAQKSVTKTIGYIKRVDELRRLREIHQR